MSTIILSLANSLRFRIQGETLDTFDNTLSADEDFNGLKTFDRCPVKFLASDTITLQVKAEQVVGLAITLTLIESDGTRNNISGAIEESLTNYDYWEFEIDFSGYLGKVYFELTEDETSEVYYSEPVEVLSDTEALTDTIKLEWFNNTYNNTDSFQMLYDTDIVPMIRINGNFFNYESEGETSVYDNNGSPVKLKEIVSRLLKLDTDTIPRYLAEMITIGMAHDNFYVNEVAFMAEKKPEIDSVGKSTLVQVNGILKQVSVLGINTHDIGFDCNSITPDMSITNHTQESVSSNTTQVITTEYLLHTITLIYNSGTNVHVVIGTSAGGNQIHRGIDLDGTLSTRDVQIHQDTTYSGTTIYFTITGTSVNIDINVQTLKNRE